MINLDWQSWCLLASAYSSATLLPGSSELALGALLHQAPERWLWWLLLAIVGMLVIGGLAPGPVVALRGAAAKELVHRRPDAADH